MANQKLLAIQATLDEIRDTTMDRAVYDLALHAGKLLQAVEDYPRANNTVDIVLFSNEGWKEDWEVLLIKRANEPFAGQWALPGGFVNENEPLHEAAFRELREETRMVPRETGKTATGVAYDCQLRQFHTFGSPGRDPRHWTISVAFYGLVSPHHKQYAKASDDAAELAWFPIRKLPPLAFDHKDIIEAALAIL